MRCFLSSVLSKEGAYCAAIRSLCCRLILGERIRAHSLGVHEHLCDSAERLLILKRRNIAQLMTLVELAQQTAGNLPRTSLASRANDLLLVEPLAGRLLEDFFLKQSG